jgi:hypothetical protein
MFGGRARSTDAGSQAPEWMKFLRAYIVLPQTERGKSQMSLFEDLTKSKSRNMNMEICAMASTGSPLVQPISFHLDTPVSDKRS